ncbi:MAG: nucleoside triphosphate pyrophosphohydrolase [Alphaproteobacteria bacterium]|nr:nucleoside triphosphate pyrophosphohydrolase [Alphaproteobacteria bacterium]
MMRAQGLEVFDHRMDAAAYRLALRHKLVEEAQEVEAASAGELVEELADVLEVVMALAAAEGFDMAQIEAARLAKRAQRGGFDGRVFNAAVEGRDDLPAVAYYLARPEAYPQED